MSTPAPGSNFCASSCVQLHVAGLDRSGRIQLYARADALDHISRGLAQSIDDNAALIAREGGKPLKWAKVEATRAESRRMGRSWP